MEDATYVQVLRESLEKKVELLQLIIDENRIQEQVLKDPNATPDEFQSTIDHKDGWVDQISTLDKGFSTIFEKVKPVLTGRDKDRYRDEIIRMKQLVTQVMDLSAKVREQEQQNYRLAQQKFAGVKAQAQKIRKSQNAVSNYYKTMNGSGYDPQFLDKNK